LGSLRRQSRCWLGRQSSEGWTGAGGSYSKMVPLRGHWQEASVPGHMGFCGGLLEYPHDMAAGFPQNAPEKPRRKPNTFYDLYHTHHHFCHCFFIRIKSVSPTKSVKSHCQREEAGAPPSGGKSLKKIFGQILKHTAFQRTPERTKGLFSYAHPIRQP
jgi:hypothetical protein